MDGRCILWVDMNREKLVREDDSLGCWLQEGRMWFDDSVGLAEDEKKLRVLNKSKSSSE